MDYLPAGIWKVFALLIWSWELSDLKLKNME